MFRQRAKVHGSGTTILADVVVWKYARGWIFPRNASPTSAHPSRGDCWGGGRRQLVTSAAIKCGDIDRLKSAATDRPSVLQLLQARRRTRKINGAGPLRRKIAACGFSDSSLGFAS